MAGPLLDEAQMDAVVQAYVAHYNAGDLDAVVALFASDAEVEDPVGTPPKMGTEAIGAFFRVGMEAGARLALDGPVRIAANHAAFPFHVTLEWDGQLTRIDVIDIFTFNPDGKIARMQAYFGARNSTMPLAEGDS